MTTHKLLVAALLTAACGCTSGGEKALEQFAAATCVAASEPKRGQRVWREKVGTASGLTVEILGDDYTGRVEVSYGPDDIVEVFSRDFFVPTAVRLDTRHDQVLAAAVGSPAWGRSDVRGWLYIYDLRKRQVVKQIVIDPDKLRKGC